MIRRFFLVTACLLCLGCPAEQPQTTSPPSPVALANQETPETPAETETPAESEAPVPTSLNDKTGIQNLQTLIDGQVEENVLTSATREEGPHQLTVWSGTEGVRRIDVETDLGDGQTESAKYYYQSGKVFSLGGSGVRQEEGEEVKYTFWAGISSQGDLIGPPFQFVDGKAGSYPEEEVRARETDANDLLNQS